MIKNLIYVIQDYRISVGLTSTQHDQQLLQFAIGGIKELKDLELWATCAKAVRLPVSNRIANLPADYTDGSLIKLGVCHCGTFIQFDTNDDLCRPTDDSCPCDSDTIACSVANCVSGDTDGGLFAWNYPIFGQPYSYSYTMGSYAIGPGYHHGGYKIDLNKQQIIFDSCVDPEYVVLEYMGDFLNDMGNALVPDNFTQCLKLWVDYERKYYSPELSVQRTAPAARVRWYQKCRDLNSKKQKLTKAQWLNLIREFTFQGVKT
jgi:hypothetical protein